MNNIEASDFIKCTNARNVYENLSDTREISPDYFDTVNFKIRNLKKGFLFDRLTRIR